MVEDSTDIVGDAVAQFERDGFRDGDLVSHEWLKWALDLPEPSNLAEAKRAEFTALSRREDFKARLLEEKQVALENVYGKGYRVVPPNEQAGFAADTAAAHIDKGLRVGRRIAENTRVRELTADERRKHDDALAKMDSFRQMVKRERKSLLAPFGR